MHQRKLWFAILPLFVTVVTLMALTGLSMYVLSAVRAYVGGEGLWSKSQKDAVFHLVRYAATADENDLGKYEQAIAVPLGDRKAREALDRPAGAIDYEAARQGFLQGRNHPDDVESLSFVFVHLRHLSYMERAIAIWEKGDRLIAEVDRAAGELRAEVHGARDPARIEEITARLRALSEELLPLEDAFWYTLGEASRWARDLLFTVVALLGAALFTVCAAIYLREIRRSSAAEAALRESRDVLAAAAEREVRYRALFESIDEGFAIIELVFDADGTAIDYRFLEVNPAFEQHTGLREASGKRIRDLVPDHDPHWFETYGRVARTGEPVRFVDQARAMGRWYDVHASRVGDSRTTIAVLFRDITERRRAEESLKRLAADLAGANRRKDEFLAVLAHELRNPLAPIRNAVGIMRLHRPLPQGLNEVFEIVDRQARHLTRLVDDLLEVSRITQGKLQLRKERIALGRPIADALEAITPIAEASGHELTVDLPAEPIYVDGDATRITQIIVNLLNNSAKFTPSSGHIRLSVEKTDTEAVLRVRDDGIGIRAEALPGIYEMFSQLSPILERRHGGLGIGLALVRGLVELHGGTVDASSAGMGRGSEFTVRLPLVPALEQLAVPDAAPPVPGAHPRRRVLVVDDNEDTARSLHHLIELMGHDVLEAHDGAEAVRAACAHEPDLVLLDIGLPGMNGYDAAREIRRQASAAIKLVAVTGWGQHEDKRRSFEAGFDLHVTKPVEMAMLRSLLESPDADDRVSGRMVHPA